MTTMARFATLVVAVSMCVGVGSVHAAGARTPSNAGLLPTSKQECRNGVWRSFGVFKGKGDCVSFVATRGKNRPAFEPPRIYPAGASPPWKVAVADLNGDRAPDVVTNGTSDIVSVLLNHGDGMLSASATYAAGSAVGGVGVGDFNGDGHPDVVFSNILDGISVLFNAGDGTFSRLARTAVDRPTSSLVVEDFNGDGTPDVSTASVTRGVAVLLHV